MVQSDQNDATLYFIHKLRHPVIKELHAHTRTQLLCYMLQLKVNKNVHLCFFSTFSVTLSKKKTLSEKLQSSTHVNHEEIRVGATMATPKQNKAILTSDHPHTEGVC